MEAVSGADMRRTSSHVSVHVAPVVDAEAEKGCRVLLLMEVNEEEKGRELMLYEVALANLHDAAIPIIILNISFTFLLYFR